MHPSLISALKDTASHLEVGKTSRVDAVKFAREKLLPFLYPEAEYQPNASNPAELAARLFLAMQASNIKAKELADACDISAAAVSGWLNGRNKYIDSPYLFRAADTLKVEARWLATGDGAMRPAVTSKRKKAA